MRLNSETEQHVARGVHSKRDFQQVRKLVLITQYFHMEWLCMLTSFSVLIRARKSQIDETKKPCHVALLQRFFNAPAAVLHAECHIDRSRTLLQASWLLNFKLVANGELITNGFRCFMTAQHNAATSSANAPFPGGVEYSTVFESASVVNQNFLSLHTPMGNTASTYVKHTAHTVRELVRAVRDGHTAASPRGDPQ